MTATTLNDLQASVQDRAAFRNLDDFATLCGAFLEYLQATNPVCIVCPTVTHYVFFQYNEIDNREITRPLNSRLFIESPAAFTSAFGRFRGFLADLRRHKEAAAEHPATVTYIQTQEVNRVVYTIQQAIGCIGDSFENANQSRKRVGQLFETLIRLIINDLGLMCEPRTVRIPIPDNPGYVMPYELDLVFSRNGAIIPSETMYIHPQEIVGSVKTTSKDRIDKVFLDKYLLTRLLGRDVPVVAIFLHDVQRASVRPNVRTGRGSSIFGIHSTFKKNHFLGYTVALNRLDGVYYVDPRPEMSANALLAEQIHDFQQFIAADIWRFSS